MKSHLTTLTALLAGFSLTGSVISSAEACTRVFQNNYPDSLITARNFDFFGPVDPALKIIPRGVAQHGAEGSEAKNAARWTTRYGSVMIYADNIFPMDGMNEKGLAGHTLFYVNGKQQQQNNQDKPVLQSQGWLSYILQNFATVDEALKGLQQVRLVASKLPIDYASDTKHIAIEDLSGDSAIIEIDNGQVHVYHDKSYRVMTNPPSYAKQLKNLAKYKNAGAEAIPGTQDADARLVRASFNLSHLPKPDNKDQAQGFVLSVVNNVVFPVGYPADKEAQGIVHDYAKYSKQPGLNKGIGTYWKTLADLSHGEYHFLSTFAASEIFVRLKEIDFSAGQPVKTIRHLNDYAQQGWQGNVLQYAVAQ